jgi:arsenate reductase
MLEKLNEEVQIINYINTPFNCETLSDLIQLLNIKPIDLIRKNEVVWKEKFKGKKLSDAEIIKAMISHPKLIERPIVVKNDKAAIGRPIENVLKIL